MLENQITISSDQKLRKSILFNNYLSIPNVRTILTKHLHTCFTLCASFFPSADAIKMFIVKGQNSNTQYYYGYDEYLLGAHGMDILKNSNATIIAECDEACTNFPRDIYTAICRYGEAPTPDSPNPTISAALIRAISDAPNTILESDICEQLNELLNNTDPATSAIIMSIIGSLILAASAGAAYFYRDRIKSTVSNFFSKPVIKNTATQAPSETSALLQNVP